MITRDVLETLQPGPSVFCYCPDCNARYSSDACEWWDYADQEQLACYRCGVPIVLASERVIIDVVAE